MHQAGIDTRGKEKSLFKSILKGVTIGAVAVAIFGLGVGVGNGNIRLAQQVPEQNKGLPADLNYASVEEVYDELRAKYDGKLDQTKLLDGLKAGLAEASGDHYTVYLNAKDAKEFNNQLDGTFSGIGAELGKDAQNNLVIVAPIADTPASKAGLRPQDVIVSIDGKDATGMSVEEAVTKIRGKEGTKVTLRVLRDKTQDLSLPIVRATIKVPSVKHEVLDGNIGYVQITRFGDDTTALMQAAAQEFKDKGVNGVVLDLRGNPGGRLDSAVDVSSLWLKEGAVVLTERQNGVVADTKLASGNNPLLGIKTAVLINSGSASASEITAGALKDNKAATLFGVKSFGKGSVQQIEDLRGGGELKVTIARWHRPNGQNIDKKGITPDTEVKMSDDDFKNKLDPQKDAAIKFVSE
ncbi:MAG TPA: S41 family peptidase [Candidatus Saccharimonadales bacterium]|nr:S41 family peptidase [Candidatus Saccharimonadales bacterium]